MARTLLALTLLAASVVGLVEIGTPSAWAQDVPVRVCSEDPAWLRPSADVMAATTWRDNRYGDAQTGQPDATAQAYYAGHFFAFPTPTGSGVSHMLDMTGLGQFAGDMCGAAGGPEAAELIAGENLVVFVLGYQVQAATIEGSELTVTVQPSEAGYQVIQLDRPQAALWRARFVRSDGTTVACADPHRILALEGSDCGTEVVE